MSKTVQKRLSAAALGAVSLAAGLWVMEANAALNVFVGYADNLRPSGFFPTPWLGAPGVVSQSGPDTFDAGAVRIENTGATAVTISGMTVVLNGGSGPTFALWSPLVIPAGDNGIFTQTAQFNFDTSDSGGGVVGGILPPDPAANGIGGCSSTAAALGPANVAFCATVQPIISFSVDGGPTQTFNDTGHILDTGHYDFINGSLDGNESINWNAIGSAASRGGTGGVPEPSTWAMMALGFAGLGFVAFRTRKSAKAAFAV